MEDSKKNQREAKEANIDLIFNKIFDEDSFIEFSAYDFDSNVITGYGTIYSKLVFIFYQEGVLNLSHAKKISATYQKALEMGAPIISILNSKGTTISDGIENLEAFGDVLKNISEASGVIPQISLVLGEALGLMSNVFSISDFKILISQKSKIFFESPSSLKNSKFNDIDVSSADFQSSETGVSDFLCENESEAFEIIKDLISYIPSNNLDYAISELKNDSINRETFELENFNNKEFDSLKVIESIADNNKIFHIKNGYEKNAKVGFVKLNGVTTGFVLINLSVTKNDSEKICAFVKFCDSFNIQILNIVNAKGFEGDFSESGEILKYSSKLIYSYANSDVPKVSLITGDAIGKIYTIFASKSFGYDFVYAFENANISVLDEESAKKVLNLNISNDLMGAAEKGFIDDIIIPSSTRKRIVGAFEMLSTKRTLKRNKKNGGPAY